MSSSPTGCARCGTILDPHFRFCPECGLPASGEAVLSTEIADLKRRVESEAVAAPRRPWGRWIVAGATTGMLAVAGLLGLVVFDRDLLERVFPPERSGLPASEVVPVRARLQPEWISVPAGDFHYDNPAENRTANVPYPYRISKHEVTNELWLEFLRSEGRRLVEASLWEEAYPKQEGWSSDAPGAAKLASEWRRYPVTNVSPNAIADFCDWLTRRLDEPGTQIRMPTQFEWEYAARGPRDRRYPWGDDDVVVEQPRAGDRTRPRTGIYSANVAVDDQRLAEDDTSAMGVVALGTNVSEWTLLLDVDTDSAPEREMTGDIPAAGIGEAVRQHLLKVAWRGASFISEIEDARRLATVWRYSVSEPTDARNDRGVRLVRVKLGK
jgi:formylglycine-generating enzyme required for sulfatase activity